jgi:hypothetical protein
LFLNILFYFIIFSFSGVGCLITYITNKNNKNIFKKIVEVMIQQSGRAAKKWPLERYCGFAVAARHIWRLVVATSDAISTPSWWLGGDIILEQDPSLKKKKTKIIYFVKYFSIFFFNFQKHFSKFHLQTTLFLNNNNKNRSH